MQFQGNKRLLKIFVTVYLGSTAVFARAQSVVFSPSLFYKTYSDDFERENGAVLESEVVETYYDIKLGVVLDNQLYLGAIYSQMSRDFQSDDVERVRTSYGASVGYLQPQGWYILAHYFLASNYEYTETLTFKGGSGFQFDLGYLVDLGSSFQLGPQISYKSFSYTELDDDGSSEDLEKGNSSDLLPMVTLAVRF